MEEKFYDCFLNGRWFGMASGATISEAYLSLPFNEFPHWRKARLVEWFGRNDPRNCVTSGGLVDDPR